MLTESPVVSVHIPVPLRAYTGGVDEVTASGDTVAEVLESAGHEHPALLAQVLSPAGAIRPGLSLYLGGTSIGSLQGLATPVDLEEVLAIVADERM